MSLSDNLVAHYKMNDNAATTVVLNAVGSTHGISFHNTDQIDVAGKVNGALSFNGTGDYINTDQTFQTVFRDSFTINSWVQLNEGAASGYSAIFGTDTTPATRIYVGVYELDGKITANYQAGNEATSLFFTTDSYFTYPSDWVMLTFIVTKDSLSTVTMSLYANTVLVGSASGSQTMSEFELLGRTFLIGAFNDPEEYTHYTSGSIDDFMIFNKSLNSNEIAFLYNSGLGTEDVSGYTEPEGGIMSDLGQELWSW
jgi:hypothetical protein